jgi:hypothetical protein
MSNESLLAVLCYMAIFAADPFPVRCTDVPEDLPKARQPSTPFCHRAKIVALRSINLLRERMHASSKTRPLPLCSLFVHPIFRFHS